MTTKHVQTLTARVRKQAAELARLRALILELEQQCRIADVEVGRLNALVAEKHDRLILERKMYSEYQSRLHEKLQELTNREVR